MNESWIDGFEREFVMRTSVFRFTNISDNGISLYWEERERERERELTRCVPVFVECTFFASTRDVVFVYLIFISYQNFI